MKKTVNLHLGFHRTATSSFQSTCYKNFNLLKKQNIFYPKFSNFENPLRPIHNHSPALCSLFYNNPKDYKLNKKFQDIRRINFNFERTLDKALDLNNNLLISGEGLSTLKKEELERLCNKLISRGHILNPFAVIRSPYSVFCSAISARVKRGEYINFNKFKNSLKELPMKKINNLKSIFGDQIKFFPYRETLAHSKGPVGFLLEFIGIKGLKEFNFICTHISMNNFNVRIQNKINQYYPIDFKNSSNIKHFKFNKKVENTKFLLTSSELSNIQDFLDRENNFLKEALDNSFCDNNFDTCDDDIEDQIQKYLIDKLNDS